MFKENLKYGNPTIYNTSVWVQLPSDLDVLVELLPLNHGQLQSLSESYYLSSITDKYTQDSDMYRLLTSNILQVTGAINFPNIQSIVDQLSMDDKEFLSGELLAISLVSQEQAEELKALVDIIFEDKLSGETWECSKCKGIPGMQMTRACPFLEGEKDKFKIVVGGKLYTTCPKALYDPYIANKMFESYACYDSGNLPIGGGLANQTTWFVTVAQLVESAIKQKEAST